MTHRSAVTYKGRPRFECMRHSDSAVDVLREHDAREAVDGVVGKVDDLLLRLEFDEDRDGAENLLPDDRHVGLHVGEDRGLDEVACTLGLDAARDDFGTFLLAGLDEAEDALRSVSNDSVLTDNECG